MYIVRMKRYTVALVRQRLAEALDEAERGVPVIVERRGVRFTLAVAQAKPRRKRRESIIETVDSSVDRGDWTWRWSSSGLRLAGRRRRS
jgi:antitoxin (DNA-binding transcriptional repressor) of toxin-antitoxin stability system